MRRKFLTTLLIFILALCAVGLTACGGGNNGQSNNSGWGSVFTVHTAYAQAQELGYTGTLEEFLASIKGQDGKDGVNGKDGADGVDGEDGVDGKGIKSVTIVNGDLIIVFTDDTNVNCGKVVGDSATNAQTHTVTFECDFVTIPSQTVKHGEKVVKPDNTLEDGLVIVGYYYQGEKWSFIGYSVTEDITLNVETKIVGTSGLTYGLNNGAYQVTGYTGSATKVYIPEFYNNTLVTSIGSQAFEDCTSLESITIPNSVTSIGFDAFRGCTSLESITIPSSVTSIGSAAFYNCSSLTTISVDSNNGYYSSQDGILYNKAKTEIIHVPKAIKGSVTIPSNVTSIGFNAFYNCDSLIAINVDSANANYSSENGVLFNKAKTTLICYPTGKTEKSYVIPNSVTSIGAEAFAMCSSLERVEISDKITSIGLLAFAYCNSLTAINVDSANANYSSDNGILYNKTKTELICYPSGKTEKSFTISNSVVTVYGQTFSGNDNLESITVPSSVTSIAYSAFFDCDSLIAINVDSANANYSSENGVLYNKTKTELICYPLGKTEKSYVIPNSVTGIDDYVFKNCTSLESITIPSSVTGIAYRVFYNCSSLIAINVDSANANYSSENGVLFNKAKTTLICYPVGKAGTIYTIPNGVTSIDYMAFYNCTSLESITIPNGVTSIRAQAFYNCTSLESITFNGTKEQWNAIEKYSGWDEDTGNYVIHCTDGNIPKA